MLNLPKKEISYWQANTNSPKLSRLNKDLDVDVAIVGGGICGLSCAYLLTQAGLKVAVLEKGRIGSGTTGYTTGKVTSQHNLTYKKLVDQFGEQTAKLYGQAHQAAIEQIEKNIEDAKIDCAWQRDDHYVYTQHQSSLTDLKAEAKTAAKLGLPASFEKSTPLPFKVAGAVKFSDQAKFNAQAYINGLARAINKAGSYVFEQSNIISIADGNPPSVTTRDHIVRAKDVIIATNVPTWPLAARATYCFLEYPTTSYIVAAKVPSSFPGMYISPDSDSFSILPVGEANTVLVGGRNHIRDFGRPKPRQQQLANFAEEKLAASAIEHRWGTWDYIAYDNMPLVGKIYPWSEHLYVATAFKKWGLTGTTVAAIILRDLITGNHNAWADTFTPHRLSVVKSIPKVFIQYIKS
jgi:glycine/D-amino acid oxidase-like deaminating enzyme